jgi:hypothetical protein
MPCEPPGANEALVEANALTGLLYPAFEYATERASAVAIAECLPPDPHGHSTLVRWYVKQRLEQAGHEVEFEREDLALLGLMVAFNGNRYRIRKADQHGFLPPPGQSRRMQQYYAQQLRLPLLFHSDSLVEPEPEGHNYFILWHEHAGLLSELSLVFPKSSREWTAEWEWHVSIPYAGGLRGSSTPTPSTPTAPSTPNLGLRLKRDKSARAG